MRERVPGGLAGADGYEALGYFSDADVVFGKVVEITEDPLPCCEWGRALVRRDGDEHARKARTRLVRAFERDPLFTTLFMLLHVPRSRRVADYSDPIIRLVDALLRRDDDAASAAFAGLEDSGDGGERLRRAGACRPRPCSSSRILT